MCSTSCGGAGYALSSEWFAPHFEFRFPLAGELSARAIHLTLRQALEPWHVLGEEGAGGRHGAVRRFVARAPAAARHRADRRSLRRSPATAGRCRCSRPGATASSSPGVRYRAWQPPSALHPTIPVHAPLTFDIVDTWMERSVAGCQYHVMHPGGRNYDQFPVNSYEAESRRLARFTRLGHTPGRVAVGRPERSLRVSLHARPAHLMTDAADRALCRPVAAGLRRARPGTSTSCGRGDGALRAAVGGVRAQRTRAGPRLPDAGAEARRPSDPRERRHLQRLRDRRRSAASVERSTSCR